jgi:hypothetical protein
MTGTKCFPAQALFDSIGVNVHFALTGTSYGNTTKFQTNLTDIGIAHIRDGLNVDANSQAAIDLVNFCTSTGVRALLNFEYPYLTSTVAQQITTLKARYLTVCEGVEWPNEQDNLVFNNNQASWSGPLITDGQALFVAVKNDPQIASLPVVGPSLSLLASFATVGDQRAYLDYANFHNYPNGFWPDRSTTGGPANVEGNLSHYQRASRVLSGWKPAMSTEIGYHNAISQANPAQFAVPPDVGGLYLIRLFLEQFRRGIARTYSYEFLDQASDFATVQASSFGMVNFDGTKKLGGLLTKDLLAEVRDPGVLVPAQTRPYPVKFDSSGTNIQKLVVMKRDGSARIFLWRASSLWTPAKPGTGGSRPADNTFSVGLTFPSIPTTVGIKKFATFSGGVWNRDWTRVALTAARTMNVTVGGAPVCVDVTLP